ncbi:MAG: hypothetical protein SOY73_12465 [Blautia sp.]|nr:hypothetical protein [Blautia sp.]MDY3999879.1 hypothetical protein [Blautia sp.]
MEFWKEHVKLRIVLLAVLFAAGLAMIIGGWKMTGMITGLVWMLLGLVCLLAALAIYNKPFENPKRKK